jgi:LysM repeat protein
LSAHPHKTRLRLRGGLALIALVAFPFLLHHFAGPPRMLEISSLASVKAFMRSTDETVFTAALLRNLTRVVWVLWAYLAASVVVAAVGRVLDRFGWSWLRSKAERFQLRSVRGLVNLILVVAVAAPVVGEGIAQAAARPGVTAPQVPDGVGTQSSLAPRMAAMLPAQAAPPQLREHVVGEGENLWEIAASQCGSPLYWRDLADLNGIQNPDLIHAGVTLKLPAACEVPASLRYVVQPGDSLTKIAQREYGRASAFKAIVAANQGAVMADGRRFTDPNRIEAGWTIELPTQVDGAAAPSAMARSAMAPSAVTSPVPAAGVPQAAGLPSSVVPGPAAVVPAPAAAGPETVAPAPPAASRPAAAPSPAAGSVGGQAAIGTAAGSQAGDKAPAKAPGEEPSPAGNGQGWHVRLPGGDLIPLSFAACLLALVGLAKARRQRDLPIARAPIARVERMEGPSLTELRRATVKPRFDTLGPLAFEILDHWAAAHPDQAVARIVAAWEQGPETAFVLDVPAGAGLPEPSETEGVTVRFERDQDKTWAIASGTPGSGMRRVGYPLCDGLLVAVGGHEDGALHIPLLAAPVAVSGPQAGGLIEAMVLQAAARCRPEDLRIVVVGDVGPLFSAGWPAGDGDLPVVERYEAAAEEQVRSGLEDRLTSNAATMEEHGSESFCIHELLNGDDHLTATIVIVGPALATRWAPLLLAGARLGLSAVVTGEWASAEHVRALATGPDGTLSVQGAGVDVDALEPCVLPRDLVEELCEIVLPEESSTPDAPPGRSDHPTGRPHLGTSHRGVPAGEAMLRMFVFGKTVRVVGVDGQDVAQPEARRTPRDLLTYLALHPGWNRADKLIYEILPEDGFRDLRQDLRAAASAARRWLLDGLGPDKAISGAELVQKSGQGYRLATERVWTDVQAFREAMAQAKDHPEDAEALRVAVAAYGGKVVRPWLDHQPVVAEQENDVIWAATNLARLLREQGRPTDALEMLRPLLDSVNNDDLWIEAMLCEGDLGAQDHVMELWDRRRTQLRQLGLEISDRQELVYQGLFSAPPLPDWVNRGAGGNGNGPRRRGTT